MIKRPLLLDALLRLREVFSRPDRDLRLLAWLGALLLLSGVAHAGAWLADGAPSLLGPVSFRKPIAFGLSSGITTLSVAWVAGLSPATQSRARWAALYAATMALEIGLIDMQFWRGVGSHYNTTTPLDGAIFSAMGLLICASVVASCVLGSRAAAAAAASDDRAAASAGTALLLASSLLGAFMAASGSASGATSGGALKLPHAVALHGLQILPALGWWLARRGMPEARRALLVKAAAAAITLLFSSALLWARVSP